MAQAHRGERLPSSMDEVTGSHQSRARRAGALLPRMNGLREPCLDQTTCRRIVPLRSGFANPRPPVIRITCPDGVARTIQHASNAGALLFSSDQAVGEPHSGNLPWRFARLGISGCAARQLRAVCSRTPEPPVPNSLARRFPVQSAVWLPNGDRAARNLDRVALEFRRKDLFHEQAGVWSRSCCVIRHFIYDRAKNRHVL